MTAPHSYTRRDFARLAVLSVPLATFFKMTPSLFAQEARGSVASAIAYNVGEFALSSLGQQLGDFGAKQAFGFIGLDLDPPDAEIRRLLNSIMSQLADLQQSVNVMFRVLSSKLDRLSYDVNVKPAQELIAANVALTRLLASILEADPGEIAAKRKDIDYFLLNHYLDCIDRWHLCLTGSVGTASDKNRDALATGLLQQCARVVFAESGNILGPNHLESSTSALLQRQWTFLDQHQALSAHYLMLHFKSTGQKRAAIGIQRAWQANRAEQLSLLHGIVNAGDKAYELDDQGNGVERARPLYCLPPNAIVWKRSDAKGWIMWCTTVAAKRRTYCTSEVELFGEIGDNRPDELTTTTYPEASNKIPEIYPQWSLPTREDLINFVADSKGLARSATPPDTTDWFDELIRRGFTLGKDPQGNYYPIALNPVPRTVDNKNGTWIVVKNKKAFETVDHSIVSSKNYNYIYIRKIDLVTIPPAPNFPEKQRYFGSLVG